MKPLTTIAQERLTRLTSTLANLRDRVREAVAGEMGRAFGDAVRDIVTALLHRQESQTPAPPPKFSPASSRASQYEPEDPWNDDEDWHDPDPSRPHLEEPVKPLIEPINPSSRKHWATAVTVGVALARWFITRRLPTLPTIAVGIVTTAVVLTGGPMVQASLTTFEVTRDLLATF